MTHRLASVLLLFLLLMLPACSNDAEPASESAASGAATPEAAASQPTAASQPAAARININTATEEELLAIPGMSDRMVHEFEEYRPYVSIRQFRREIGKYVDEAQVAAYEQHIFVPVHPNESDAETLRQLPGLEAAEAEALIAARPYASQEAFLEQLADYVSEEELTMAATYLTEEQ